MRSNVRKLKVEEKFTYVGKLRSCPAVRLKGKWLEAAGFRPGKYLELAVISQGVLELRIINERPVDREFQSALEKFETPVAQGTGRQIPVADENSRLFCI